MRATLARTRRAVPVLPSVRPAAPPPRPVSALLELQRTHGNRFVQRVVGRAGSPARPAARDPDVLAGFERATGPGRPLDRQLRARAERTFGADLGAVRVHADGLAGRLSRALGAQAFTTGQHIFFAPGEYRPASAGGRRLLAHELTHVVQQQQATPAPSRVSIGHPHDASEREADRLEEPGARALEGGPAAAGAVLAGPAALRPEHAAVPRGVQRRLIVTGGTADVDALIALLEPESGLTLERDVATGWITIAGSGPAASPALASMLVTIIDDERRHAEIHAGRGQPGVLVGAFPETRGPVLSTVQHVDLDDLEAIEAGAPGQAVVALMHEIVENYAAHGPAPAPGLARAGPSHTMGVATANLIVQELIGPGNRVAQVRVETGSTSAILAIDYETFFLVIEFRFNPYGPLLSDVAVSSAARVPRAVARPRTIDGFASASDAVPAGGQAAITEVATLLRRNPISTVVVEGFTDDTGSPASNLDLGRRRAERARDAIITAGAADWPRSRFHVVGRGATRFGQPNDSPAGRARNRRVEITVARPEGVNQPRRRPRRPLWGMSM
jgi:flagellar motor protein MotB